MKAYPAVHLITCAVGVVLALLLAFGVVPFGPGPVGALFVLAFVAQVV